MAEYGVSSRAQFFKTPTKELAYVSGGKFIEIYPKNTVSETSKNPIIFEWGPMAGYSYNFRDSRLVFKLKILMRLLAYHPLLITNSLDLSTG